MTISDTPPLPYVPTHLRVHLSRLEEDLVARDAAIAANQSRAEDLRHAIEEVRVALLVGQIVEDEPHLEALGEAHPTLMTVTLRSTRVAAHPQVATRKTVPYDGPVWFSPAPIGYPAEIVAVSL